jgi:hypothetical protein
MCGRRITMIGTGIKTVSLGVYYCKNSKINEIE